MQNEKKGFTHDSAQNQSVDWYTPAWIFERLGLEFDLDPCQPIGGVPWIPAKKFYTEADDGLSKPWEGRVWLNPQRYGIICLNSIDESLPCKQKNAQSVMLNTKQQQSFFIPEKTEITHYHHGVEDAPKNMIEIDQKTDPNLQQELNCIKMLNLALRYAAHAVKKSLCQLITLDCALRYERGLTLNVKNALKTEREKRREDVERILLKEQSCLKKNQDIVCLIKDEKQSVFNLSYLIMLEGSESPGLSGTGVLNNGSDARKNGDINALIAVMNQENSRKTTSSPYQASCALEQRQKTLSQPACPVTAKNNTSIHMTGQQKRQFVESSCTFSPFSVDYKSNVWLNPPYGREIGKWVAKAHQSAIENSATVVSLLPARVDTRWWHDHCAKADVYFIKGRLKFGNAKNSAPFPSAIVTFRPDVRTAMDAMS